MKTGEQKSAEHCYQDTEMGENNGSKFKGSGLRRNQMRHILWVMIITELVTRVVGGRTYVLRRRYLVWWTIWCKASQGIITLFGHQK